MMKGQFLKAISICIIGLLLSACATKKIMPPLSYNKSIDFQVAKKAFLHWEVGKQYASTVPSFTPNDSGLIGAAIYSIVDSADRGRNPSRYTLGYGKAEQAIFMTSLKKTLEQNQVFKAVEFTSDPGQVCAQDVLINIYFKTARVASPARNYKVTLSVEMVIATQRKAPFKRTYVVESNTEGFGTGFIEQQTDASQQLLEKIIMGIEQWHTSAR